MPFKSHAQESFMKHNNPSIWKRWVQKYGHYSGTVKKLGNKTARAAGNLAKRLK